MSAIALPLTNVIVGALSIGTGIGFTVEEQKKMDELHEKSNKLKDDVTEAGNLYDHVYYLVTVNADRMKKAVDKLPNDFLEKVEKQIESGLNASDVESALTLFAKVMGYASAGFGVIGGILQLVVKLRAMRAKGQKLEPEATMDPFDSVPLDEQPIIPPTEGESSLPSSPKLTRLANGLNIGGIVFGVAGLATTIGLGVWTLEKLNKAISDVEKKQTQVDKFKNAMEIALDSVIEDSGLPPKQYNQLPALAEKWKKISENFDSYEKSMYYAIEGYSKKHTEAEIKKKVDSESDAGKPFPDDGYPLAKTLSDDIQYQFKQKKTDKEVVAFFATENPKLGLRFVLNEYFVANLRDSW